MFNSVALNVVIGLVFIFLLYSLLATTINEGIASVLNLRAQKLEKAITRMLDDGVVHHHNIWGFIGDALLGAWLKIKNFFLLFSIRERGRTKNPNSLVEEFYNHPAIKYLGENKISNKPSYISAGFFSKAVLDILKDRGNAGTPPLKRIQDGIAAITPNQKSIQRAKMSKIIASSDTKKLLESMLEDANYDLEKFRLSLEQWFNETMNRTSGWYKKQSQKITFVIGFVLAIAFNVDTISIVKKLSNDPDGAAALADIATQYVETHKDTLGQLSPAEQKTAQQLFADAKAQVNGDISNANSIIGLGWVIPQGTNYNCNVEKNALGTSVDSLNCKSCLEKANKWLYLQKENQDRFNALGKGRYVICLAFSSWRRIIGYLLTALAVSFGAPFWFDLLNKFIQLRGAGKKPEEPAVKKNDDKMPIQKVG